MNGSYYQIVRATTCMHAADSHSEQDLSSLNLNVLYQGGQYIFFHVFDTVHSVSPLECAQV